MGTRRGSCWLTLGDKATPGTGVLVVVCLQPLQSMFQVDCLVFFLFFFWWFAE